MKNLLFVATLLVLTSVAGRAEAESFTFTFSSSSGSGISGSGTLEATLNGDGTSYTATSGTLTDSLGDNLTLIAGSGPSQFTKDFYDNQLFPSQSILLDSDGLGFADNTASPTYELNIYWLSGVYDIDTGDSDGDNSGYYPSTFTLTDVSAPSVPEPSSLAMCGLAGVIGSAYAWRRRKRAAIA